MLALHIILCGEIQAVVCGKFEDEEICCFERHLWIDYNFTAAFLGVNETFLLSSIRYFGWKHVWWKWMKITDERVEKEFLFYIFKVRFVQLLRYFIEHGI